MTKVLLRISIISYNTVNKTAIFFRAANTVSHITHILCNFLANGGIMLLWVLRNDVKYEVRLNTCI